MPPTMATTATAGLGVRVDPDRVACPPTRPAGHTPAETMRTVGTGSVSPIPAPPPCFPALQLSTSVRQGQYVIISVQNPSPVSAPTTLEGLEVATRPRNATTRCMRVSRSHPAHSIRSRRPLRPYPQHPPLYQCPPLRQLQPHPYPPLRLRHLSCRVPRSEWTAPLVL